MRTRTTANAARKIHEMKPSIPLTLALALFCIGNVRAEGIVTLTCSSSNRTNEVQVAEGQYAKIISFAQSGGDLAEIYIVKNGKTMRVTDGNLQIAGPATFRLVCLELHDPSRWAFLTVEILPAQFPPDRAVTVGPYSGDVRVTMEMSTDLVNWTVPQNAAIYTNAPDARFFCIKIAKNIEEQAQQ